MGVDSEVPDKPLIRPDYRHVYPVGIILIVLIGVALGVRHWLIPETFGQFGFYRGAALEDARDHGMSYVGGAACAECHGDIVAIHDKDAHGGVPCETCHGPGTRHIRDNDIKMPVPATREDCLVCHRKLDARPGSFPQVDWQEHFRFLGVADTNTACVQCHSAHEPLFMDRDMRKARLHPLIHQCGDCHLGRTDPTTPRPDSHPQIFQCDYCHPAIAASRDKTSHKKVACSTCHMFVRENSFSGRIVRNADPRFCLLCHRRTPFKSPAGPPMIEWPGHIKDAAGETPDAKRSCTDCHQDNIHDMPTKVKGVPHAL